MESGNHIITRVYFHEIKELAATLSYIFPAPFFFFFFFAVNTFTNSVVVRRRPSQLLKGNGLVVEPFRQSETLVTLTRSHTHTQCNTHCQVCLWEQFQVRRLVQGHSSATVVVELLILSRGWDKSELSRMSGCRPLWHRAVPPPPEPLCRGVLFFCVWGFFYYYIFFLNCELSSTRLSAVPSSCLFSAVTVSRFLSPDSWAWLCAASLLLSGRARGWNSWSGWLLNSEPIRRKWLQAVQEALAFVVMLGLCMSSQIWWLWVRPGAIKLE